MADTSNTTVPERNTPEWHKLHPIFFKPEDMTGCDVIELLERCRSQMSNVRGKLSDIAKAYPRYDRTLTDVEGLLTCGLVAMHLEMYPTRTSAVSEEERVAYAKADARRDEVDRIINFIKSKEGEFGSLTVKEIVDSLIKRRSKGI